MKTRISGNSIRFRLSITDLDELKKGISISQKLPFHNLNFSIELKSVDSEQTVHLGNQIMTFSFPKSQFRDLSDSDQEGFKTAFDFAEGRSLHISIEKDYKCVGRDDPDKDNYFARPEPTVDKC